MTVREALLLGKRCLKNANIPAWHLDAELILSHILEVSRLELIVYHERTVSKEEFKLFWRFLKLRADHVPVAYIVGHKEFYGLDLAVEPGILIPRPETEFLVEKSLAIIAKMDKPRIADICCGSGAIAVAIAVNNKKVKVFASDISPLAQKLTEKNSKAHNVEDRVIFLKGNLFSPFARKNISNLDLIVSNPPYIPKAQLDYLPKDVKKEPKLALDGGEDGLNFYRIISKKAAIYLKPGGHLILEIGWNQARDVKKLLEQEDFMGIEIMKDYAGFDRVVLGKKEI